MSDWSSAGSFGVNLGIEGIIDAVAVGRGTYGVVYRATQPAYHRTVAVKVFHEPLTDDAGRRRFERECQALGSLSGHPNIVTLHSAGITKERLPYLVMAYLPGGSLAVRMKSSGPLGWPEAVSIGVKLSGALTVAHRAGIIHRDVKPANILVSFYGEPQLADFGIARMEASTSTATSGMVTGTLAYTAPEVLSGRPATAASDIWSLASTLSALLAGESPFSRPGEDSMGPLISRILSDPPRDLRSLAVPVALCESLEAALAKDPAARPRTAAEFGEALRDVQRAAGTAPTSMAVSAGLDPDPTRFDAEPTLLAEDETPNAMADPGPPRRRTGRRRTVMAGFVAAAVATVALVLLLGGRGQARSTTGLTAGYDNSGISDDTNTAAADFDQAGDSYSAEALAARGLTAGATVTQAGLTYVWPNVGAGHRDNVTARGQTLAVTGRPGATTLGILGSAVDGPATSNITVTFTDGTTQLVAISLSDWTLRHGREKPAPGDSIVAAAPYLNSRSQPRRPVANFIFSAQARLTTGRTVTRITLGPPTHGSFHVFALAIQTPIALIPPPTTTSTTSPGTARPGTTTSPPTVAQTTTGTTTSTTSSTSTTSTSTSTTSTSTTSTSTTSTSTTSTTPTSTTSTTIAPTTTASSTPTTTTPTTTTPTTTVDTATTDDAG